MYSQSLDLDPFPPERPRLGALTPLRFLAAAWVMLYHAYSMYGFAHAPRWVQQVVGRGYVAVTFFFALSGFVLVYTYAGRELKLGRFWRTRLARLYPVYLFSLLLTLPMLFMAGQIPGCEWMGRHIPLCAGLVLTMQQAWIPRAALAWNAVCWAVSAEIFFYVVFPWLLNRMVRMSLMQLGSLVLAGWVAALGTAGLYCLKAPDGIPILSDVMKPDGLPWLQFVKFSPLVRLPEFVAGMAAGIAFLRRGEWLASAERLVLSGSALLVLLLLLGTRIPYPVMHTGLTLPAFLLIILGLAQRPIWASVLDGRFFQLLGESSYSLYLFHSLFIGMALFVGRDMHHLEAGPDHAWLRLLLGSLVATAVGLAVFRWVEEPLRKRLTKR